MHDPKLILLRNQINRTKFRTELLNLFYNKNASLTVEDIMSFFNGSINKVTVYRSLDSFEKKGLIHRVPDSNNCKRYSLCKHNECSATSHNHNHGHFICYSCNKTFCLEDVKSPKTPSLKGFKVQELKLTFEGYCKQCNKN